MGGVDHHTRLMEEIWESVRREYEDRRFSTVGLLAIKALEQAIEACVAKEGLHFHDEPKMAHLNRRKWLSERHPDLAGTWDDLWSAYGTLGYGGVNGRVAKRALNSLDRALTELRKEIGR